LDKLDFRELTIEDRLLFNTYFSKFDVEISEYTFTNLFLWKNSRIIKFAEYNNGLIILANQNNEKYFMPPIGFSDYGRIIKFLLDSGKAINCSIVKRITESHYNSLKNLGLKIIEDRDSFDYVYASHDLAHLKGRKYSSKRNFITNFLSEYTYEYKQYEEIYYNDCLRLTELWISKKDKNDKTLFNEYLAIKELLNNFSKLNVTGAVLLIDGQVQAFAFGEKLNNETFVIHFEKANLDFKGLYQVINKLFIENEIAGRYDYVNREQDLGIPGIRKAKESYFPVKMIKKYIVTT